MRNVLAVAGRFAVGGSISSIGYVLGGIVAAVIALIAVVLVSVIAAVMLSAMLGRRDSRSPFTRLMLIVCVITGRHPGDYLAGH